MLLILDKILKIKNSNKYNKVKIIYIIDNKKTCKYIIILYFIIKKN